MARPLHPLTSRNDDLLARIARFSADPASYADPSHWREMAPEPIGQVLIASARARAHLARLWQLPRLDWDLFKDPRPRIALLEANVLQRLVAFSGAAFHAEELARLIDATSRNALREAIGAEAHEFAIKRSRVTLGDRPAIGGLSFSAVEPGDSCLAAGRSLMVHAVNGEPPALQRRLLLKFPLSWGRLHQPVVDPGLRDASWHYLRRILLKELDPDLAPCFD